ncbi:MAG TPA: hypothetical protein VNX25_05030 [Verrucomicrobiae bacterium]|nr:hypothetical protein [Verrucomicrobiae bacterium]
MTHGEAVLVQGRLPFLLSLPRGGGKRPVLLFLHGYDEGAPLEIRAGLTRHGPLRPGSSLRAAEFIVVAPQLPLRGDLWGRYAECVLEIVARVHSVHQGDPRRTFLTGFSFGGNGVFDIALRDPTVWSGLWGVDPTRVPEEDPGLPVWLSSGEVSRRRREGFMQRLALQPAGEGEPGRRVYSDDGLDHVGTATAAYSSDRVYDWLLSLGKD